MKYMTENTFWIKIYIAGPIEIGKQILRKDFLENGLCVTIDPTLFIYTGGEEQGYVVGILNYPRFPKSPEKLWERAIDLAIKLLDGTYQHSVLIESPDKTEWITKREN